MAIDTLLLTEKIPHCDYRARRQTTKQTPVNQCGNTDIFQTTILRFSKPPFDTSYLLECVPFMFYIPRPIDITRIGLHRKLIIV